MLFSIFTPTNDTRYLMDLYESLKTQTSMDFEWVILLNNGAKKQKLTEGDWVKYHTFEGEPKGIGELKSVACSLCKGDYLVEVDHDDVVDFRLIEYLSNDVKKSASDFIYSDFLEFKGGESNVYSTAFGWENYEVDFKGNRHTAMRAFEIDPATLSSIHHAPNHVRVWKKEFYDEIGGHNKELNVCDDYDLVLRTYLAGGKFSYIPECLYYYRLRGDEENTYIKNNREIQVLQKELSRNNTEGLVKEWCRREGLDMYDLGGAYNKPEGYLSVDLQDADINADIRKGLPFKDNSVGCIRAVDFLEHIPTCKDSSCKHENGVCTIGVMNEIYRVLVPNGWLLSATPSTGGRGAFQDQTHVSFWNPNSFWYYTKSHIAQYYRNNKCRFIANDIREIYPTEFHKNNDILYVYANLIAIKEKRVAGFREI